MTNALSKASKYSLIIIALLYFYLMNVNMLPAFVPHSDSYDTRRIINLFILAFITIFGISNHRVRQQNLHMLQQQPPYYRLSWLLLLALGVASSALAPDIRAAFLQLGVDILLVVLALTIASLRIHFQRTFDRIALMLLMMIIGAYCILTLFIYCHLISSEAGRKTLLTFGSLITNPYFTATRFLTQIMTWTLPLLIVSVMFVPQRFRAAKIFLMLLCGYWWTLAIIGESRALVLEWLVILIGVGLCYRRHAKAWYVHQFSAIAIGCILFVLLYVALPHWLAQHSVHSARSMASFMADTRLALWRQALHLIIQHPLLGVGPMQYAYYFLPNLNSHPHNLILNFAAEWGIPACLIFIGLIATLYYRWLRFSRQQMDPTDSQKNSLLIGLTAAITGGLIHAQVSGLFIMPVSQLMGTTLIGWALGHYQATKSQQPRPAVRFSTQALWIGFIIIVIAIVAQGIFPAVLHLEANLNIYLDACLSRYHRCLIAPNFWMQGWLRYPPKII